MGNLLSVAEYHNINNITFLLYLFLNHYMKFLSKILVSVTSVWLFVNEYVSCWVQASRARLFKEYKEVQREKVADPDIQLVCDDSNIFKWTALIKVCLTLLIEIYIYIHIHLFTWLFDQLVYTGTIRNSLWRRGLSACFFCSRAISFTASSSEVFNKNISSKCTFQGMYASFLCFLPFSSP